MPGTRRGACSRGGQETRFFFLTMRLRVPPTPPLSHFLNLLSTTRPLFPSPMIPPVAAARAWRASHLDSGTAWPGLGEGGAGEGDGGAPAAWWEAVGCEAAAAAQGGHGSGEGDEDGGGRGGGGPGPRPTPQDGQQALYPSAERVRG